MIICIVVALWWLVWCMQQQEATALRPYPRLSYVYEIKGDVEREGFFCFADAQPLASLLAAAGSSHHVTSPHAGTFLPNGSCITIGRSVDITRISAADCLNFFLPLSLATASVDDLMLIPGIGEKTARAIIAYRDAQGGITDVHTLSKVDGISEKKLKRLLPYITL
ncbi:MAG: helix-hairpin-helix domain-containing protein [Desulfobacterota bacterium]|nr:helix-hairpin-helix domain-containing protein [Thermodesulfobacteriota bacterium]